MKMELAPVELAPVGFAGAAVPLRAADVESEAARLGVEAAAVWAVCDVESAGRGFLPDPGPLKRPKILFEAHVFGKLTRHRWDGSHPAISAPALNRALYGPAGAHQYDRLAVALGLDRAAALEAASWGMFQVLGANFAACGFASAETYVAAMCQSEGEQLQAFGEFCRHGALDRFLRGHDWTRFALAYNGPAEADNEYDRKLAAAYARRKAAAATTAPASPHPPAAPASSASDAAADALNRAELARLR